MNVFNIKNRTKFIVYARLPIFDFIYLIYRLHVYYKVTNKACVCESNRRARLNLNIYMYIYIYIPIQSSLTYS